MKYEVTVKNDFGVIHEIVVRTNRGYESALVAALDRHYEDESEVCEVIIKRVEKDERPLEYVTCKECAMREDCENKESRDGCYFGEREIDIK